MKTVIAESGQTLYDIAIQEMGSPEGAFDILELNPLLRLDIAIPAGFGVLVPDSFIKPAVVDYYTRNGLKPISDEGAEVVFIDKPADIIQIVDYDVSSGPNLFNGIGKFDANPIKSLVVDYNLSLDGVAVPAYLQRSTDGQAWEDIPDSYVELQVSSASYTFDLTGIEDTYYIRFGLGPGVVEGFGGINKITYIHE